MSFNKYKAAMEYNRLGEAGVLVSKLSFGCMTFSDDPKNLVGKSQFSTPEACFEAMKFCFERGVNFFDNAEIYGGAGGVSERLMGEAIQMGLDTGIWTRKDLVISTKLYFGTGGFTRDLSTSRPTPNSIGLSRKHLYEGMRESLERMGLEYVDLVFCHRPDPRVEIEETVRGMNFLIDRGLAFYWGTSEWSAQQLTEARAIATRLNLVPPMFDQCEYSLIKRDRVEAEYAPLYPNLGLTIWSPLAGGLLTGKYKRDAATEGRYSGNSALRRRNFALALNVVDAIRPIADELGCSLAELTLAWAMKNQNVSTVMVGASRLEQLEDNFKALDVVPKLTPEVLRRIDVAAKTAPKLDRVSQQTASLRGSAKL